MSSGTQNTVIVESPALGSSTDSRLRLPALTGLRFFAAVAVVLGHFRHGVVPGLPLTYRPGAAVSFFFVLSGFVLTYSYSLRDGRLRGTPKDFYWARFGRIYPAYLFSFVLAVPWFYLHALQVHGPTGAVLRLAVGAPLFLSLLQSWIPWMANWVNPPAWAVSVEAFSYLLFPLILRLLRRIPKQWIGAALGLSWLLSILPPLITKMVNGLIYGNIWSIAIRNMPILRLPEFIMGCLTARLFLLSAPSARTGPAAWVCIGILLALLGGPAEMSDWSRVNGLFAPLFCLLIWFASSAGGSFKAIFASPVLIFLGQMSYSIYILQAPLAFWFPFITGRAASAAFFPFLAVLLGTSAACFMFLERPARRAIRNLAKRLKATAVRTVENPDYMAMLTAPAVPVGTSREPSR